jgi:hypothetical protein
MYVDGHLKYFSYEGYYWVIDDKPDARTTKNEAELEWKVQEARKSAGIYPANPEQVVGEIVDYMERHRFH